MSAPNDDVEKLRILARFPHENPNPVMRVSKDNKVVFANDACAPILSIWDTEQNVQLPERISSTFDRARTTRKAQRIRVEAEDVVFQLDITPVAEADHVYVYGKDVTAQLLAEAQR